MTKNDRRLRRLRSYEWRHETKPLHAQISEAVNRVYAKHGIPAGTLNVLVCLACSELAFEQDDGFIKCECKPNLRKLRKLRRRVG